MPSLVTVTRRLIRRFGVDVIRYRPATPTARLREYWLRRAGIDLVLDVGANVGQYSTELRAAGYRGRIGSFEPLPDVHDRLQQAAGGDPLWDTFNYALGASDGPATIHLAANTESSSLLPMAELHNTAAPQAKIIGTREIAVRRLDSVAGTLVRPADRVWLKIDVQGTEGAVLEGARDGLGQVLFIEQELSLDVLYEGQELIETSIARLRGLGFVPIWFEDVFSRPDGSGVLQYSGIFRRASLNVPETP